MPSAVAGICLALATAATSVPGPKAPANAVFIPTNHFTLAWTHSIEKIRWEEDYAIRGATSAPPELLAVAARVHGSGAGMEPPPDARLRGGWYEYTIDKPPLPELLLTRSGYTADYELCVAGVCRPMSQLLPSDGGITRLWPCLRSQDRG
ncbi:MAG: DUF1850 domain-containing protein [Ramlibacter sp.]